MKDKYYKIFSTSLILIKSYYLIYYILHISGYIWTGDITLLGYSVGFLCYIIFNCFIFTVDKFNKEPILLSWFKLILFMFIGYLLPILVCYLI